MTVGGVVQFAGGLGLFLLGMKLMTEGLQVAAGPALRSVLARSTSRPWRGVASGALITALVQSSSAVIFATIGFVNAGLMNLLQAVGVIWGANLGTTFTSWIVATAGLRLNLQLLAMPAIALGMLLRVVGRPRTGALGEALAGLGIFLLGIEVLKNTFGAAELPLDLWTGHGPLQVLFYFGAGVLITLATQSSSATVAITLTAAAGGLLPVPAAAAVIIGADVGTTSTAALAAMGATPNARRAASAHVLFNLIGGSLALLALPLLLPFAQWLAALFGAAAGSVVALALFHTLIKALGLAVMWPLTPHIVTFLQRRFRAAEEDEGRARYLDHTLAGSPALAMDALREELGRVALIGRRLVLAALSAERPGGHHLDDDQQALTQLVEAVGDYTLRIGTLAPHLQDALPLALRIGRYHLNGGRAALEALGARAAAQGSAPAPAVADSLAHWRAQVVQLVEQCAAVERGEQPVEGLDEQGLLEGYQPLKAAVLREGAGGRLQLRHMVAQLDELSALRRVVDQSVKAARQLARFDQLMRAEPVAEAAPEPVE